MNLEVNKTKPVAQQGQGTVDKAAHATSEAIGSAQQTADRVVDKMVDKVDEARSQVKPAMDKVSEAASTAADRARIAMHDASDRLQEQTRKASEAAIGYTRDEPVKAMLLAAAAGAVLMAVVSVIVRSRD